MTAAAAFVPPPSHASLVSKYDGRAPRYTSYPTAVQFTPAVNAATYRRWLGELPIDEAVSVYVHVPFCARLCWYCGCNTRVVNTHGPVADYVAYLQDELSLLGSALPGRLPVSAVHLGGGTPNMLKAGELDVLFRALSDVFRLDSGLEVAAEIDPLGLTQDWVRAAARHGLSRASLGVQNLSPQVQEAVNRREGVEDVARCVGWLREAGVGSINLDLMYGLPHQTVGNTLATIDQVLPLRPERLALFGYAHVPWMKAHQQLIHEAALPGAAERLEQSEVAAEHLIAEGYVRIGLDHFALPSDDLAAAQAQGRLRRNFQGYTTDSARALIGVGASAIGSLPQGFVQNASQELAWRNALAAGDLPIARGVAVTNADRLRGEIIERLMCDLYVDLYSVCCDHGRDLGEFSRELAQMASFERDGLVTCDGGRITVTEAGRLVVRSICAVFDTYFAAQEGRHSRTL
ncbi:MAG: oxygen-independent coproporphyrinogen III oxidase [Pseudomonadota bacterium]|uniref:oxygen-independent coproporphyrinogen III oxidase n=1 Tax=Phenylobacterium sp. TaxID=1871053 RepID=UPI0025DFDDC4|nr:oxygen-independent coproporphyrinogen III oxidase [Phenylobacterium sp.]MBT9471913.1 oxygen-independent coproporphyrinogen III oxidase [Phenylobacterium sp.]